MSTARDRQARKGAPVRMRPCPGCMRHAAGRRRNPVAWPPGGGSVRYQQRYRKIRQGFAQRQDAVGAHAALAAAERIAQHHTGIAVR